MKIKVILMSMLVAVLTLAGCSEEMENERPIITPEGEVGYLSVAIKTEEKGSRANGEESGSMVESDINSVYLLLFKGSDYKICPNPNAPGSYYIKVTNPTDNKMTAQIYKDSKELLVIVNPGPKLLDVIKNTNASSTYATVNAAITGVTRSDVYGSEGFAMISSGNEPDKGDWAAGSTLDLPFTDITGYIQDSKDVPDEKRVKIKVERLASKIFMQVASTVTIPADTQFEFTEWTLDVLNQQYYPFAKKHLLDPAEVPHNDGSYTFNFYTEDPNYDFKADPSNTEWLSRATIDKTDYSPKLPQGMAWMQKYDGSDEAKSTAYCIENTMAADKQQFGNATRVVIKAKYAPYVAPTRPGEFALGDDWFNFAGINYKDFDELHKAYTDASKEPGKSPLRDACDRMYTSIKNYLEAKDPTLQIPADFEGLNADFLKDNITNGGEIIKTGENEDCIRWYQGSLNYYYYEIRHNNTQEATAEENAFSKYGVVRNNWYKLTLNKVNGAGTPWYPDVDNPGPGDPDPTDPIDKGKGWLGIEVDVAPWIVWENPIEI